MKGCIVINNVLGNYSWFFIGILFVLGYKVIFGKVIIDNCIFLGGGKNNFLGVIVINSLIVKQFKLINILLYK